MAENQTSRPGSQLELALSYAAEGWPVFPAHPDNKKPLSPRGFHDATRDIDVIRTLWARLTSALVAIPTGQTSGIWVLDVDGPAGKANLSKLIGALALETIGDLSSVAFLDAAHANGALNAHGAAWLQGTIRRALEIGARDPLPPLARNYREGRA